MDPHDDLSNDKDQQLTALKKTLEERTQQLQDKDAEYNELKKKYRQKKRKLIDKNETIEQLKSENNEKVLEFEEYKRQSIRMQHNTDVQNNNLKDCSNEKELESEEWKQQMKRTNDDLESYVEFLLEMNDKLQAENNQLSEKNLEDCSNKKDVNSKESQQQTQQSTDELNERIQHLQNDVQALLSEIENLNECITQKDHEIAEYQSQVQQSFDHDLAEEDMLLMPQDNEQFGEEIPLAEFDDDYPMDTDLVVPFCDREEQEDQEEPEVSQDSQQPENQDGFEDQSEGEKASEPEDQEAIQEQSEPEDQEAIQEQSEPEDTLDHSSETPVRRTKTRYTEAEIQQVVHYIFNVCKPITFSDTYWTTLAARLANDRVSTRTSVALRLGFSTKHIFNLYKNRKLHTAEHRRIAMMAFCTYGRNLVAELSAQYDKARKPGTTVKQIAQMKSLVSKRIVVKREGEKRNVVYKRFSEEESEKLIGLVFNVVQVKSPKERDPICYWERINEELIKLTNYRRTATVTKTHFIDQLLPTLHNRKQLTTPEHRNIATELYNLWYEPDISKKHIELYDSERQSTGADAHSHIDCQ